MTIDDTTTTTAPTTSTTSPENADDSCGQHRSDCLVTTTTEAGPAADVTVCDSDPQLCVIETTTTTIHLRQLPRTGGHNGETASGGLALIVVGVALVATARRRLRRFAP